MDLAFRKIPFRCYMLLLYPFDGTTRGFTKNTKGKLEGYKVSQAV